MVEKKHKNRGEMRLPEAVAILESQRKLNDLFTKEENAIMLLQSILPKLFHDEIICASITFSNPRRSTTKQARALMLVEKNQQRT